MTSASAQVAFPRQSPLNRYDGVRPTVWSPKSRTETMALKPPKNRLY